MNVQLIDQSVDNARHPMQNGTTPRSALVFPRASRSMDGYIVRVCGNPRYIGGAYGEYGTNVGDQTVAAFIHDG